MPIGDPALIHVQPGQVQNAADVLKTLVNQTQTVLENAKARTAAPYWNSAAKANFTAVVDKWHTAMVSLNTTLNQGQGLTQTSAVNWPYTDGKVASYWQA
jgi:uncharacterized protein YukE